MPPSCGHDPTCMNLASSKAVTFASSLCPYLGRFQEGVEQTGVSVAYTVLQMDAGPIIASEVIDVDPHVQVRVPHTVRGCHNNLSALTAKRLSAYALTTFRETFLFCNFYIQKVIDSFDMAKFGAKVGWQPLVTTYYLLVRYVPSLRLCIGTSHRGVVRAGAL